MTFNTGNPVGSTDPRDLYDNASNFDEGMNKVGPSFTDRLGVLRKTWNGMETEFDLAQAGRVAEFQAFLAASGYVSLGNYAAGLNFTAYNQYMARDGFFYRPAPSSVPFTTTGTWVGGDESLFVLFPADDALRQDLAAPGGYTLVNGAISRAEGAQSTDVQLVSSRTLHQRVGDVAVSTRAPLQRLLSKLAGYKFGAVAQTFRIYGFGSSVGNGAELPNPATQAPVIKFAEYIDDTLNRAGVYPIQVTNKSVDGSIVYDFLNTDWPAVVASGVYPDICLFVYGMNDFATAQFNSGQTIEGFEDNLRVSVLTAQRSGADVVLCTTPHPHTERFSYSLPTTVDMTWPVFAAKPVADASLYPPAASATTSILADGANIPCDVRFLHGNELIRKVAADLGCALIDAERYWFNAVAANGQDALYGLTSDNHPNLLGHQSSYWAAFDQFCAGLVSGAVGAVAAPVVNRGLVVRGNPTYDTAQQAMVDVTTDTAFGVATILRDQYGRPIETVEHSGIVTQRSYTAAPWAGPYSASLTTSVHRTKGLFAAGEFVDIPIPQEGAARIFVNAWFPGQPTWGHAANIIAVNPDGITTTFSQQTTDVTGGVNPQFTVSSVAGGLRITVVYNNTTLIYAAEHLQQVV